MQAERAERDRRKLLKLLQRRKASHTLSVAERQAQLEHLLAECPAYASTRRRLWGGPHHPSRRSSQGRQARSWSTSGGWGGPSLRSTSPRLTRPRARPRDVRKKKDARSELDAAFGELARDARTADERAARLQSELEGADAGHDELQTVRAELREAAAEVEALSGAVADYREQQLRSTGDQRAACAPRSARGRMLHPCWTARQRMVAASERSSAVGGLIPWMERRRAAVVSGEVTA